MAIHDSRKSIESKGRRIQVGFPVSRGKKMDTSRIRPVAIDRKQWLTNKSIADRKVAAANIFRRVDVVILGRMLLQKSHDGLPRTDCAGR
jgi:hypothetical protein